MADDKTVIVDGTSGGGGGGAVVAMIFGVIVLLVVLYVVFGTNLLSGTRNINADVKIQTPATSTQ